MPGLYPTAGKSLLLLSLCYVTSSCSANLPTLPTPVWRGANAVGLLCRVTAADSEQARQIEDQLCSYAQARLQQSLDDSYAVDRLELADGRILQPQRVSLVFDARLQWHDNALTGYTLTLSSRQFRHHPGAPAATVFFESPSVLLLPGAKQQPLSEHRLMPKLKAVVERHLQRLLQ